MGEYIADNIATTDINDNLATSDYFEENDYVVDIDGEYCSSDEVISHEDEYYHKSHDNVFVVDNKLYHKDSKEYSDYLEAKEKENEAYQVKITQKWDWILTQNNRYTQAVPVLGYYETKETTLRDNYQLDSDGIPQRLPELNFA